MKQYNSFKQWILESKLTLRERVFVVLTMSALLMSVVGLLGDLVYGENPVECVVLLFTALVTPTVTAFGIMRNKVELATRILTMGLLLFVMPAIFIFGGGPKGGAIQWLVFCYLYMGLVLDGRWRGFSLVFLTIEVGGLYYIGYNYPKLIHTHSKEIFFIDSALAVIEVGIVCFVMTWFQSWLLKEENRKVREEAKKFEELNRNQNRFFSSMSHEIRTPINSILGLNELILRQDDASDEIIRDAGNIQGAGKMLLSLINDILDISKIEAGKMEIVPVNYSMASLISEIVNMMWLRAEQKGLKLLVEVDPYLPSELFGDEVRIKQILINILNNAVKYTQEGSITLHIEAAETRGDKIELVFIVSDTGMGIKQDALPYLFDAFQRVDEEKNRKIEGTGLGLSIVKQLVDLMGGKITVDSVYMQGSTFIVTLQQAVVNPKTIGNINLTSYGSVGGNSKFEVSFTAPEAAILIVDDNEMNLEVEKKLLLETKMQIDTATSGTQALSMCISRHYDMIFMDHMMPEMDGIECMQRLRKQAGGLNNYTPIIALTANAGSENRELYNQSGFDGYLVKPVSGKQLEESLLQHLPEIKVIRNESADDEGMMLSTARDYSRKIPILVTTSSMCDLPQAVLKENQIDTTPFTIIADGKEYYDGVEAGAEELLRYKKVGVKLDSRAPSTEEFEVFFAEELKKAHQVIYLAVSSGISKEYEAARKAATTFGNVYVFDTGYNSSALGLMVLRAYLLSTQGKTPGVIIEQLEKLKKKVHCSFITNDSSFLEKRGVIGKGLYGLMNSFGYRPFLKIEDGSIRMARIKRGDLRKCYEKYIEYALPKHANCDLDVLMVPYVNMDEEDIDWLAKKVRKLYNFKNIVFKRASAVMSLNCGEGAFGILYLKKSDYPYQLGELFDSGAEVLSADAEMINADEEEPDSYVEALDLEADVSSSDAWYCNIPGIDGNIALKNSGSEDALQTVFEIFYNAIDIKAKEINDFYESEDWTDYTIKVHALKSSSRLIGAIELAGEAEALEMAGKADDIDFIRTHHDSMMMHFLEYKDYLCGAFDDEADDLEIEIVGAPADSSEIAIDELAGKPTEDSGEKSVDSSIEKTSDSGMEEEFDGFIMESIYESLKEGVAEEDTDMIRGIFEEMEDYPLPTEYRMLMNQMKSRFENDDLAGMIKIIEENENE